MTDDQDQNDIDLDVQEDLDRGAAKPSLKEAWQGNPLLKVGAAVLIAAVAIGAYTTLTKPNPVEETKSFVNSGADVKAVKAVPGKDTLDKAYTEAVKKKNEQRAEMAAATGGSALPTPIATGKDSGLPIPQQNGSGATDPLQEWKNNIQARKIRSEEANLEDDMATQPPQPDLVPLVQPVHPQPIVKMDPQAAAALSGQMRTIITTQKPGKSKLVSVTTQKSAYDRMIQAQKEREKDGKSSSASSGGTSSGRSAGSGRNEAKTKVITAAGQIFYAQLLLDLCSDIPSPALAAVMSGPFAGGRAIGKMSKVNDYLVITFDRIVKDDVNYRINGIALDEGTTLPALQSDVDHHYFDRVVLPVAAKFVSGYADSVSQTGTTTTTTAGGGVATAQPKPDAKESVYKGISGAGQAFSDIMTENRKKEITVWVRRGTTMGVLLLDPITTGSVENR